VRLFRRSVLVRVLYDAIAINVAFVAAFTLRVVRFLFTHSDVELFLSTLSSYFAVYSKAVFFFTVATITIFYSEGFYTRTRGYIRRYKALIIARAVTISYLVLILIIYYFQKTAYFPRASLIMGWFFTLLLVGVPRLVKAYVARTFKIEYQKPKILSRKPERVLVIGGAGYIGSVLIRRLLERGYYVRVLDSLLYGEKPIRELLETPSFEFIPGDFRHVDSVVSAVKEMDAVIHLGAIVGDPASAINSEFTIDVNLAATRMIRAVCRGYRVKRFLFASTCSVYGVSDEILDERSVLRPVSLYAQTKIDAENAILSQHDKDFSPTILRLSTVFGWSYRPRFDLVVNLLVGKAIKEGEITIFGGNQWRPFVHVEDACRAFMTCLEAPLPLAGGEVFNVGSNHLNFQIQQIGEKIREVIPDVTVKDIKTEDDVRNYRVAFDKIHNTLGFSCTKTVEDGIFEIKRAFDDGFVHDYRDERFSNSKYLMSIQVAGKKGDKKAHILVIDDEEGSRSTLTDLLKMGGHQVEVACDGREGVETFKRGHHDLVLTDLGMPMLSGWKVAKMIKEVDAAVPVVLVTGWTDMLDEKRLRENGVDVIISKPFRIDHMLKVVKEALHGGRGKEHEKSRISLD
jgi:nucleoside-diphosphate-sugar epimerase/CheY-like chemotaxis protein